MLAAREPLTGGRSNNMACSAKAALGVKGALLDFAGYYIAAAALKLSLNILGDGEPSLNYRAELSCSAGPGR